MAELALFRISSSGRPAGVHQIEQAMASYGTTRRQAEPASSLALSMKPTQRNGDCSSKIARNRRPGSIFRALGIVVLLSFARSGEPDKMLSIFRDCLRLLMTPIDLRREIKLSRHAFILHH